MALPCKQWPPPHLTSPRPAPPHPTPLQPMLCRSPTAPPRSTRSPPTPRTHLAIVQLHVHVVPRLQGVGVGLRGQATTLGGKGGEGWRGRGGGQQAGMSFGSLGSPISSPTDSLPEDTTMSTTTSVHNTTPRVRLTWKYLPHTSLVPSPPPASPLPPPPCNQTPTHPHTPHLPGSTCRTPGTRTR